MKGLLHKTEQGWFVGPTDDMAGVIYPLHPKDKEMMDSIFTAIFTKDVNFEIIYVDVVDKEYLSNKVPYAKLVNMIPDKSDREVKLSAYKEMAENSWEGCDGCTEDDKYFYIKGYVAALCRSEIDNSESWGKETGY